MIRKIMSDLEWEAKFGKLGFHIENGKVIVSPEWEQSNIVSFLLPIFIEHKFQVNRNVVTDLVKIFTQIEQQGLDKYIDIKDTELNGGCYCPRFSKANRTKLSRHSWGVPFDLNPTSNQYGTKGAMSPEIIKIFNDNGWCWFGDLEHPDPMHFELAKIVG